MYVIIIKKPAHGATYRQKGLELPPPAGLVPAPLGVEAEGRPAVRLHVRRGGPSANSQGLVSRQHRFWGVGVYHHCGQSVEVQWQLQAPQAVQNHLAARNHNTITKYYNKCIKWKCVTQIPQKGQQKIQHNKSKSIQIKWSKTSCLRLIWIYLGASFQNEPKVP